MEEQKLTLDKILHGLVQSKLLAQATAADVSARRRSREETLQHPLTYLAEQQLPALNQNRKLKRDDIGRCIAEAAGLSYVIIDPLKIQAIKTTAVMSLPFAQRHHILCIAVHEGEITIACTQPYITEWVAQLEHVSRCKVRRVFADPQAIERYTREFYALSTSVAGAATGPSHNNINNFEQLLELGDHKTEATDDRHVVQIVDGLLQYAFDQRASDIHIEPRRNSGRIRFRIDGVLHPVHELPAGIVAAIVSRIKVLGRMNVAEKRKPQDGRVKTRRSNGSEVELRLSTLPTAFGEKLVIRIFDPEVLLRSFAQLGLQGEACTRWNTLLAQPYGIVLVTGPTGSGKSTTLYSSLKGLATDAVNVSTIEDPIEMIETSFNQTQVQHNIGLDFAMGLRTLMRQDPDVIMVGEIRDLETAQMAAQAALTGHLVLSTLHTNDAATGITRLLDLGLPAYLIRSAVAGIMAQRLVRTLCGHCKTTVPVDAGLWRQLVAPWQLAVPKAVCQPVGCKECRNTGYSGRQGIYELFPMSPAIQRLVAEGCDASEIKRAAIKEGMHTLRLAGSLKIAKGITSVDELLRVAPL